MSFRFLAFLCCVVLLLYMDRIFNSLGQLFHLRNYLVSILS
jgi:hypothetical protein